nr:hypothetical protein 17 [Saccharospirillaceae bacterium]
MLTVVTQLFSRRFKETHRERALSNQVDHLEIELAKARRENEAKEIRLEAERRKFEQSQMRNYPADQWPNSITQEDLFSGNLTDPIEQLLIDLTQQGVDVSAQWLRHRALLELIAQYQLAAANVLASIGDMHRISEGVKH